MKVKVNGHYDFDITIGKDHLIRLNADELDIDLKETSAGKASVIYKNKPYSVELVTENRFDKTSIIKVNGISYQINIEDQYDQLLKQLGIDLSQVNKVKEIKAPMPGLVLNVVVSDGQEVNKGDSILILEAMKMENIIKSPAAGTIKKILIQKRDKVEKNQLLLQFL